MNPSVITPIVERALAKINLYLHVTGLREDGYHLLDSMVVFAQDGGAAADEITLTPSDAYQLRITGPQAALLKNESSDKNLVTRALRGLASKLGRAPHVDVQLYKMLPVASGIGGGSADAAAALRAAAQLWDLALDHEAVVQTAKETGADVLACLYNKPCYFGGIGDEIEGIEGLPRTHMVLVNPNIPLATAHVFKARKGAFHDAARLPHIPASTEEFAALLCARSNDLQPPAILLCETITDVLNALNAQNGCLLARLSGSGATCFGLFARVEDAEAALYAIHKTNPNWWVAVSGF
ncbi:MAG: 4-(cytidine 5'-diphospho)-2-C-methyl-D-erythritol kinase [Alphaproteobacteria bacterium]|nr:4-(cytidine 5'-diphospho)-2-C-methyl-D-erythritol kinase [Alphaproteobacteria bacterium]